jgi:hypothetical protein
LFYFVFVCFFYFSINAQKIYSSNQSYQAEIKGFVVKYKYQADLKVFKVDQPYKAKGNSGLWSFTNQSYQAEKKIIFVAYDYQSDLNIYFVNYKYFSGWKNSNKKHLLY